MNLFSGLLARGATIRMTIQDAVMVPVVAAMLADGHVEDDELLQIEATCSTSPLFERCSQAEVRRLILRTARMIEDHGLEKICVMASERLSPALRETAYTYAAQVIFSDGYLDPLEREVMESLAGLLMIEPGRARALIDVVSVMQHPETA